MGLPVLDPSAEVAVGFSSMDQALLDLYKERSEQVPGGPTEQDQKNASPNETDLQALWKLGQSHRARTSSDKAFYQDGTKVGKVFVLVVAKRTSQGPQHHQQGVQ
ncbi:UNVERIFIED_CONTAM: hypothetical protein K2H54_062327 [Gekko kuhli]